MEDDQHAPKIARLTGVIVRGTAGLGTKSEREAHWLETDQGRLLLRRKLGPTFGDGELNRWVGQRVTCDGFRVGDLVLAERIAAAPEDEAPDRGPR